MAEINVGGMKHSKSLARILNNELQAKRFRRVMVEVGVYRGQTSAYLLQNVPNLFMHLVDPWEPPAENSTYAKSRDRCARQTEGDQLENMEITKQAVEFAKDRVAIHRGYSWSTAREWKYDQVDLVFIDGAHDYENVVVDLRAWWPLVKPGGILSGHDYSPRRNKEGVVRAVNEFCEEKRLGTQFARGTVWWARKPLRGTA